MPVVINTNSAATMAAANLASTSGMLQRSLNRLSSGSRIVSPADDAGGLAVSMKLGAAAHRQAAAQGNLANASSFLQTQDGALNIVGRILNRMSELKTLHSDPTKNSNDLSNYDTEFSALQSQITAITQEKFNGISLFGSIGVALETTGESSSSNMTVGMINLLGSGSSAPSPNFTDTFADLTNWDDTSTGAGSVSLGSGVTLTNGSGSASLTTKAIISGPATIEFEITSGDAQIEIGGTYLNSFIGFSSTPMKLVLDGAGNMETFVNNLSLGSNSGLPTSGVLNLSAVQVGGGGSGTANITNFSITGATSGGGGGGAGSTDLAAVTSAGGLGSLNVSTITSALQDVAGFRAQSGAEQSRIAFASELLVTNQANMEAATSRITDVDVATESTQMARFNILVQAGTSMLSQANQSSQAALRLLS